MLNYQRVVKNKGVILTIPFWSVTFWFWGQSGVKHLRVDNRDTSWINLNPQNSLVISWDFVIISRGIPSLYMVILFNEWNIVKLFPRISCWFPMSSNISNGDLADLAADASDPGIIVGSMVSFSPSNTDGRLWANNVPRNIEMSSAVADESWKNWKVASMD